MTIPSPYLICSSLSVLLSKALVDVFPAVELISVAATDLYFRCRFLQEGPIHPEMEVMIEERLRGLLKEKPLFESIEMEKKGCIEYFRYHKQPLLAEEAAAWELNIVPAARVGTFTMFYPKKVAERLPEGLSIKIFEIQETDNGFLLEGAYSVDKQELKSFIKARKEWQKALPKENAERLGLLYGSVILPKGVAVCRELERKWEEAIASLSIQQVITAATLEGSISAHLPLCNRLQSPVAEWGVEGELDLCYFIGSWESGLEWITKCLQMIDKTARMSGMSGEWFLFSEEPLYIQAKQWRQEVKCLADALEQSSLSWSEIKEREVSYGSNLKDYLAEHPLIVYQMKDTLGESVPGPFLRVCSDTKVQAQSLAVSSSFVGNSKMLKNMTVEFSLFGPLRPLLALLAESGRVGN